MAAQRFCYTLHLDVRLQQLLRRWDQEFSYPGWRQTIELLVALVRPAREKLGVGFEPFAVGAEVRAYRSYWGVSSEAIYLTTKGDIGAADRVDFIGRVVYHADLYANQLRRFYPDLEKLYTRL